MEQIIEVLVLIGLVVWIAVGGMTIAYSVFYHRLMKPIMGPMMNMYKEMIKDFKREFED